MSGNRNRVCQFFLEGRCRFGDGCKYEHPDNHSQNQNRFAPLGNQPRGRSNAFASNSQETPRQSPFAVTADSIKLELTDERPAWPLSCYGPGRDAPRQLLDVEFEQSPEEMRVLHYMALANGNPQETPQRESSTADAVNQAIQKILSDINGAVKYIVDGKDQHPNRIDMAKRPFGSQKNTAPSQGASPFGAPNPQQTSSFGQPSSFGRNTQTTTFGQPSTSGQATSFGQPSSLGSAAFGQPSGLGQTSAFGQPSGLGGTSAFGKPSFGQPAQPSGFGQASQAPTFGQPAQSSGFGQAAQAPAFGQSGFASKTPFGTTAPTQSSFGQPSAFGAAARNPSPFGGAANATQSSPFGALANGAQSSPFAAAAANTAQPSPFGGTTNGTQGPQPMSTFGQPSAFGASGKASPFATAANGTSSQQQQSTGTFGQPSPFGAAAKQASPFGQPAQPQQPSSFGQPAQSQQPSPFGQPAQSQQPSSFGAPSQSPSPFAQASQTQPNPAFGSVGQSPFAQNSTQTQSSTFGQASQPAQALQPHVPTKQVGDHLTRDGQGRLTSFKGQPVSYDAQKKTYTARNPRTGRQDRIWFPDGIALPHKDAQAPEEMYEGELGQALAKLYLYVKENGVFENGIMPEIPPKSEWVAFDM